MSARGTVTMLASAILATAGLLSAAACSDPVKQVSVGSYQNAVSHGTTTELAQRGIVLRRQPKCHTPGADQVRRGGTITIRCEALTVQGAKVVVHGHLSAAGTPAQSEHYIVTLADTQLLNSTCLGSGCQS